MTASPSTASVATPLTEAQKTYLEDLFLHARGSSRMCLESYQEQSAHVAHDDGDPLVTHENAIANFLAAIAPAAVAQVHQLAAIAPNYEGDLSQLTNEQIDVLMRSLFAAAGLSDDFMTSRERSARYRKTAEFKRIEKRRPARAAAGALA